MFKAINEITTEKQFLEREIAQWLTSKKRAEMLTGERYFRGEHDILKRQRVIIGNGAQNSAILKNSRIIDNQYAKAVNQKTNYLLGKPLTFDAKDPELENELTRILGKRFQNLLRNICTDALNHGIAWLGVFFGKNGELKLKRFSAHEILPFWKDAEHTELDMAVRFYRKEAYSEGRPVYSEYAEIYKEQGIERYRIINGELTEETEFFTPYITDGENKYSWGAVPLIAFKSNNAEIPLLNRVKSLQDALNELMSDFHNNMSEDVHNTILVLKNYEGENLAEFRRNLAVYGAVKVRTVDGAEGGIETLKVDVNADNYAVIIRLIKRAIIENAMSFDSKDERIGSSPNQMNLLSMYSDIDLDANCMEIEFQASIERFFYFVTLYLQANGKTFTAPVVDVIFNRDMLMNESEVIENLVKSKGILSNTSLIAQHPWVKNIRSELERLENEKIETGKEMENNENTN